MTDVRWNDNAAGKKAGHILVHQVEIWNKRPGQLLSKVRRGKTNGDKLISEVFGRQPLERLGKVTAKSLLLNQMQCA